MHPPKRIGVLVFFAPTACFSCMKMSAHIPYAYDAGSLPQGAAAAAAASELHKARPQLAEAEQKDKVAPTLLLNQIANSLCPQ